MPSFTHALALAFLIIGCGHDSPERSLGDGPSADAAAREDGPADLGPGADLAINEAGVDSPDPDSAPDFGTDSGIGEAGADAPPSPDMRPDSAVDSGSADSGGDDAPAGDGACAPLSADPKGIGRSCENPPGEPDATLCPDGYECVEFFAFISTYTCEIRCARNCECPPPSSCGQRCDNVGCFDACVQ